MTDIQEAKRLMELTAPRRDIRIPLIKIALACAVVLAGWWYHDRMTKRVEFLEAAVPDLNIRLYHYGVTGGLR
jgi:hypothetical protein